MFQETGRYVGPLVDECGRSLPTTATETGRVFWNDRSFELTAVGGAFGGGSVVVSREFFCSTFGGALAGGKSEEIFLIYGNKLYVSTASSYSFTITPYNPTFIRTDT